MGTKKDKGSDHNFTMFFFKRNFFKYGREGVPANFLLDLVFSFRIEEGGRGGSELSLKIKFEKMQLDVGNEPSVNTTVLCLLEYSILTHPSPMINERSLTNCFSIGFF